MKREIEMLLQKYPSPKTVGRGCKINSILPINIMDRFSYDMINIFCGDSLALYSCWPSPITIISDGAYGILGFDGDTASHNDLVEWYEPHIKAWSQKATPQTTLWFWNSEIGWATVHPILEKYGWKYENANIWNKGKGHIAGNVNTSKIRRFPVVTELCVQYSFKATIHNMSLQEWLLHEWKRTGLKLHQANEACGVKNAASRKYLTKDHLWYYPPVDMFEKLVYYANEHGNPKGRPYFSIDGYRSLTKEEWKAMINKFKCPYGWTNVWERPAVHGKERLKIEGRRAHLNQKPLDLMQLIIEASTDIGDVIWEPFGGLFSASIAAKECKRHAYGAEINPIYFHAATGRISSLYNL